MTDDLSAPTCMKLAACCSPASLICARFCCWAFLFASTLRQPGSSPADVATLTLQACAGVHACRRACRWAAVHFRSLSLLQPSSSSSGSHPVWNALSIARKQMQLRQVGPWLLCSVLHTCVLLQCGTLTSGDALTSCCCGLPTHHIHSTCAVY